MALTRERTPKEKETLMFADREQAREFAERVTERERKEGQPAGVRRRREIVGEEVAEEFARAGQPVETVKEPWEHTPEEHQEAQTLVDMAFSRDLQAALRQAKNSPHFPRLLDLFHDVLTGEMYEVIIEQKLNRQPIIGWGVAVLIVICLVVLIGIAIIVLV
ncbi:MAG: hypothetical protein U1C49_02420 [Candidatus Andersenbacteria bacterium]|nr:hypothetical protein [Candidatus Andersenbacteria bacterium]